MKTTLRPARKEQAPLIASMIMTAMDLDCCQNFAGPDHTLNDFHRMMTHLVEREDSQYSYRNTLTAIVITSNTKGKLSESLAGILVGYDGRDLHRLREAFFEAGRTYLGRDFRGMDDETHAGEYYADSLCVLPEYRGQGIATALLREFIRLHGQDQPVGLLVDQDNPKAEHLYRSLGFQYAGDATWGGHPMHHLQCNTREPIE